jgi:hypothetical protein
MEAVPFAGPKKMLAIHDEFLMEQHDKSAPVEDFSIENEPEEMLTVESEEVDTTLKSKNLLTKVQFDDAADLENKRRPEDEGTDDVLSRIHSRLTDVQGSDYWTAVQNNFRKPGLLRSGFTVAHKPVYTTDLAADKERELLPKGGFHREIMSEVTNEAVEDVFSIHQDVFQEDPKTVQIVDSIVEEVTSKLPDINRKHKRKHHKKHDEAPKKASLKKMHGVANVPSFPLFSGVNDAIDENDYEKTAKGSKAFLPTGDAHQAVNNIINMFNMM